MAWTLDARIPLTLLADAGALAAALAEGPPAAVLLEAGAAAPSGAVAEARFDATLPHAVACACCQGRGPVAEALDRLFLARVRGQVPWFQRVLALAEIPPGQALVAAALVADAVTAARFRRETPGG
jgi:hypothetical protein